MKNSAMPKEMIDEIIDGITIYAKEITANKINAAIILVAIILGIYLGWENMEITIFAIFVASILHPIDSRYFAAPALFFLALTPFLLILDREAKAEEFAVYAYYFLVMAVIRGIIEVRSEKNDYQSISNEEKI